MPLSGARRSRGQARSRASTWASRGSDATGPRPPQDRLRAERELTTAPETAPRATQHSASVNCPSGRSPSRSTTTSPRSHSARRHSSSLFVYSLQVLNQIEPVFGTIMGGLRDFVVLEGGFMAKLLGDQGNSGLVRPRQRYLGRRQPHRCDPLADRRRRPAPTRGRSRLRPELASSDRRTRARLNASRRGRLNSIGSRCRGRLICGSVPGSRSAPLCVADPASNSRTASPAVQRWP